MALDVRVNSVNTRVGVVDGEALLSPEVLETIVRAVKAALAEDGRIAAERDRDRLVDHGRR
jgi:hypothetical protein